MKANVKKIAAWGCGLPVVFIILAILLLLYQTHKTLEYAETGFQKDYSWNGINVGVVIRFPINTTIPIGRYSAIIAFKDDVGGARILFHGPMAEAPERPTFVSGKEQAVVYRTSQGEVGFDLTRWLTYPSRDSITPDSDRPTEAQPGGAANESQPSRAETNRTSPAAGSRR